MKDEILKQLCSGQSVIRVVFVTVALGMGVDIKGIRQVIHITPPYTIQAYCHEMGNQHLPFFITAIEILQK